MDSILRIDFGEDAAEKPVNDRVNGGNSRLARFKRCSKDLGVQGGTQDDFTKNLHVGNFYI